MAGITVIYAHLKFQFLLGRLETSPAGRTAHNAARFQFLLGRLETWLY